MTPDERRAAVLGHLATHADVTWHEPGGGNTWVDEVLELADRLRRRDEAVVPMRPARVATEAERRAAMVQIRTVLQGGAK